MMPLTNACLRRSSTGAFAPRLVFDRRFVFRLYRLGEIDQALGRIIAAIQQHVFDAFAQLRLDLLVNCQLSGIHDSHVEPGVDRMIKKRRVHRLAHSVVSAKRKRNVADSAADTRARQICFDPARGFDEIDRVIAMLFQAGGDGQNIRIKNDVVRRETARCLVRRL